MPKQARRESSTQYYHIMQRGINKKPILIDELDKQVYLNLLSRQQKAERIDISAWCIMDNHVHIILKAELGLLAEAMHRIGFKYANYYNRSRARIGAVFNERFKSVAIEEDSYFLSAIRYVHNNPVKAELVEDLTTYNWCSFNEYIGDCRIISEKQKSFLLNYFTNNMNRFIQFHEIDDDFRHLGVSKESSEQRMARGRRVFWQFCEKKQLKGPSEITFNKLLLGQLCVLLISKAGLNSDEVANIAHVSSRKVLMAKNYYKKYQERNSL